MSEITSPVILDSTGKEIVEGLARQNILLSQLVSAASATPAATLQEIHAIVQAGEAANVFSIGDQILVNWNDGTNDYVLPFDIVHFADVTLQDGETVPGMFIQSHYALMGIQFDATEAIFVAPAAMPAGTYHFTIGTNWGTHCVKDKVYQFTTATEIPEGGCIVVGGSDTFYTWGAPDVNPSNWKVWTFGSLSSVTPLDNGLSLSEGSDGTDLGTISSSIVYGSANPNNLQRAAYGYNRWSQSAMRQWLNSDAAAGSWWTPQNPFDRPPKQHATTRGFKAGLDEAFLHILKPVKVKTALNTVTDSGIGTSEDTYDMFFCSSLEEEYIVPQLADVEGPYWEYWKQRLGLTSPQTQGVGRANAFHIRYGYDAKTTAQSVRLRSASRGGAGTTWGVTSTGNAYYHNATNARRPCPACVIC